MRTSPGKWIAAVLLTLLLAGAPARADVVRFSELGWSRTALALASLVYTHLAAVPREGGAAQQWHEMHARTARLREEAKAGRGTRGLRDMSVREGEAALAQALGPDAPVGPQADTHEGPGTMSTIAGPGAGRGFHGNDLAAHTRDDLYAAIHDLPPASLAVASYVTRFTGAALVVTLNLKDVLLRETALDWETLMKQKSGLQDRLADWKKKRKKESLSAKVETRIRMAVLDRLARSMFKIGFGVVLGIAMWLLVRRF